ncbi:hypothetical protein Trydic_g12208 [Trypoxylus dichotomus]
MGLTGRVATRKPPLLKGDKTRRLIGLFNMEIGLRRLLKSSLDESKFESSIHELLLDGGIQIFLFVNGVRNLVVIEEVSRKVQYKEILEQYLVPRGFLLVRGWFII